MNSIFFMRTAIISLALFSSLESLAQVPKKVVVEHFTNTYCSVCASRNPGLKSNIAAQNNVLHLSIHPSAPYSQCYFNRQNKTENDARTQYNAVFGSTPRIVINGVPISASTNYANASIFDAFQSQTSDFSIRITGRFIGDSVWVETTIKAVSNNTAGNANLFVALANERVNYAAANGEQTHTNVFRKSVFSTSGLSVGLPAMAGDSIVISSTVLRESIWGGADLFALAILNNATSRAVIQTERSANFDLLSSIREIVNSGFTIYPNPVQESIHLEDNSIAWEQYTIYNLQGKLVRSGSVLEAKTISTDGLNQGIYILELVNKNKVGRTKFSKQ